MPVDISCNTCGAVYEEDESVLGTEVQCGCGNVFTAEAMQFDAAPTVLPEPTVWPAEEIPDGPTQLPPPTSPGKPKPTKLPPPTSSGRPASSAPRKRPTRSASRSNQKPDTGKWVSLWLLICGVVIFVLGFVAVFLGGMMVGANPNNDSYKPVMLFGVILMTIGPTSAVFGIGRFVIAAFTGSRPGLAAQILLAIVLLPIAAPFAGGLWQGVQQAKEVADRVREKHRQQEAERRGIPQMHVPGQSGRR